MKQNTFPNTFPFTMPTESFGLNLLARYICATVSNDIIENILNGSNI